MWQRLLYRAEVSNNFNKRYLQTKFGLLFDIDGVVVRGQTVIPEAKKAFQYLVDKNGQFKIPTIFVTNGGNSLRKSKAFKLSNWLGVQISEDQVVMSYSPVQTLKKFTKKHVLVTGQGPLLEIAKELGIENAVTVDKINQSFPLIDAVDQSKDYNNLPKIKHDIAPIEGILMIGEPIRWERTLQVLIDVLLGNGKLWVPTDEPLGRLPIIICNMDKVWMAEAPTPRIGHGSFVMCLEMLYKIVSGDNLKYSLMMGKPNLITYLYSEKLIQRLSQKLCLPAVENLYCIGDNPHTDILGANLFNEALAKQISYKDIENINNLVNNLPDSKPPLIKKCNSVLVSTGVFSNAKIEDSNLESDAKLLPALPTVANVQLAVEAIFRQEGMAV